MNPIVLIPSRLAATRLPRKPLADINGRPMIVHCLERAVEADLGPVVVACADQEIFDAVAASGGTAVMTRAEHPSGSDRIFEALETIDADAKHDVVVNLQGDLPTIEPAAIRAALTALDAEGADIGTIAARISDEAERDNPNVVKVAAAIDGSHPIARALYFSRATVPAGDGDHFHHIGLYAYRRAALATFVKLPPGRLETRERLEQLRALEAGLRIDVSLVDTVPLGVDTRQDLERARKLLQT